MDLASFALASAAICLAWLAPGACAVRLLGFGRDGLERFVLAVALGRLLLALATLVLASSAGSGWLWLYALCGTLGYAALVARDRRGVSGPRLAPPPRDTWAGLGTACVAAALLIYTTIGRSGLPDASGTLVFFGRDTTNDPLVYASMALRTEALGLPFANPFAFGQGATNSYFPYALLGGLHALGGAAPIELAFRWLPFFDAAMLGVTCTALVRALGGGAVAMASGPALLLLGGEASHALAPAAALFGGGARPFDSWALFGPYLVGFNPVTPAMQTLFCAWLLLLRAGGSARRQAVAAGLLVAALFEIKLFLWLPALGALALVAWMAPGRSGPALRRAALWGVLASLPSIAEKLLFATGLGPQDRTSFEICPACLPRYFYQAILGTGDTSFALFRNFELSELLDPRAVLGGVAITVVFLAVALGARAVAIPELWRALRPVPPDAPEEAALRSAVVRVAGLAAALGLLASVLVVVNPHYLNGAQFAFAATLGLCPLAALRVGRWSADRRFASLAAAALLAFPASLGTLWQLGYRAPESLQIRAAERELMRELAQVSAPADGVLEPSILADPDRPSAVPFLAGRSVYLSLLSQVLSLPEAERSARFDHVLAVFSETDRDAAFEALDASGVRFVYLPTGFSLHFDPGPRLERVLRGPAGEVYRVREGPGPTLQPRVPPAR